MANRLYVLDIGFWHLVSELVESDEDIIPARHLARVVGKIVGRVYILQDWRKNVRFLECSGNI